jgi:hypothetical protein
MATYNEDIRKQHQTHTATLQLDLEKRVIERQGRERDEVRTAR